MKCILNLLNINYFKVCTFSDYMSLWFLFYSKHTLKVKKGLILWLYECIFGLCRCPSTSSSWYQKFLFQVIFTRLYKGSITLLAERFFLASLLACTFVFENMRSWLMRNTRDANDFVHALKGLARKKRSVSRVRKH